MTSPPIHSFAEHQHLDDQVLAAEARNGDIDAFEQLVRRWQLPLVRFLERRVGTRADAEDLFQETMLRVYRSLGDYDSRRPFRTWVFTIAWRLAANHHRDRRADGPSADDAADRADPQPGPLRLAEMRDEHRDLWDLASRVLPEHQVTMLWLFYVQQMPAREIAAVMGRSWVAVKTGLHRARHTLGRKMAARQAATRPARTPAPPAASASSFSVTTKAGEI